jgi:hypothetical protein
VPGDPWAVPALAQLDRRVFESLDAHCSRSRPRRQRYVCPATIST